MISRAVFALLAAGFCGCVTQRYTLPMTRSDLARLDGSQALAVYLSQAEASPAVCDLRADAPHVPTPSGDTRKELLAAFREGRVPPKAFSQCVTALLQSGGPPLAAALLEDVSRLYVDTVRDGKLEHDLALQARLDALTAILLRPTGPAGAQGPGALGPPAVVARLGAELREVVADPHRGPFAVGHARAMLEEVGLESGLWAGKPVDVALLDQLAARGDAQTLARIAARVPDPALRLEARKQVVRLRIRASQWPGLAADPEVEERVVATGVNAVPLVTHRPISGALDLSRSPSPTIEVEQLPAQGIARLRSPRVALEPVAPGLPLRGALWVQLDGIPGPVTLCGRPEALDPTPCVDPAEVRSQGPLAQVDPEGTIQVVEALRGEAVLWLAREGARVAIPLSVGGQPLVSAQWTVHFQRPPDLVFKGVGDGAEGPRLSVEVERLGRERLLVAVDGDGRHADAVVEWPDAAAFRVVSRGAEGVPGASGLSGSDGLPGSSGLDASCPASPGGQGGPGGDGSPGGAGGAGGPGGRGGPVLVTVSAPQALLAETLAVLRGSILSEGGAGGPGGEGGPGGDGGAGGPGGASTTCTDSEGGSTSLPSGSSGFRGSDGSRGWDGPPGAPGAPGSVSFQTRSWPPGSEPVL